MAILILRIFEKLLIIYFTVYLLIDIGLFAYSFSAFLRKKEKAPGSVDFSGHRVSIIVPAYNEEVTIVNCTEMLLELDYPDYEVIVINDGSKDKTLQELEHHFKLVKTDRAGEDVLTTARVINHYSTKDTRLMVIDKENGGKADSINTGINYSDGRYICTIDADSILDPNALREVVRPFLTNAGTMVTGGQLAAANDTVIIHNKVVSSAPPRNIWVLWQIVEYIKSFMISRMGLSRINALLIMSGAFSLYCREDLKAIGGFLTARNRHPYLERTIGLGKQTVCEDMEILVRLWQYKRDQKIRAKAIFLPEPVCWTEVPDNGRDLFRQRSRWQQGLGETLKIHHRMILEPSYGVTGMIGLPYYLFFELFSPIVRIFTAFFIIAAAYYGIINFRWVLLLLTSVMLITAIILSAITAIIESWSQHKHAVTRDALRYKGFMDWIRLIMAGILAEFSYSFFKVVAQTDGMIKFLRKRNEWNKFSRKGVKKL
ncbi:MAG: glycosyltransferase [Bacteroidales bacterium]|nr:glycosyltransferase [Bacteroidales bacterium]